METGIYKKFEKRLKKWEQDIENNIRVEQRKIQIEHREKMIQQLKNIEQTVLSWEEINNKTFNGSAVDVLTYNDLAELAQELSSIKNETPASLLTGGEWEAIPITFTNKSDLKNYIYLSRRLIQ